jgi:aspartate kinase
VLNATAVEFAKEREIALLVRRSDGQGSETVVRMHAPRAPGVVVGIAHEESVIVIASDGKDPGLDDQLLGFLDEQSIPGKQLSMHRFGSGDGTAVVVSREKLPDPAGLGALLKDRFSDRVRLGQDLGAVSMIGAGINQTFDNLRRTLKCLDAASIQPAGVHTSSFRITALIPNAQVKEAVQLLHKEFIEESV